MHINNMLNTELWIYGQGQTAKLKKSQSEIFLTNVYKYDAAPRLYGQTPLL
jgi:hypothetical protein